MLCLNPDVVLEPTALREMIKGLFSESSIGSVCAKLYRADDELRCVTPKVLDSTGMILTYSLRHFDRGSEEKDTGQFSVDEFVFGGTGACLLLKRSFVEDVSFWGERFETDVDKIYPQLLNGRSFRTQLFDEAFFAYREDADLAWRGQTLEWKCRYVSNAIGYHRRVVLPENRKSSR